jgi:outer membrane protein OmpA-like peptidoglycan-associated protein
VVELAGFTDQTGSENYNLDLSRRRAWAVQRYLVEHKVPLYSIHMVGLGEEVPPSGFQSDLQASSGKIARGERNALARRVSIRVFGANEMASAGPSEQ